MSKHDTTRALRRHHVARLKKARANYWGRGRRGNGTHTPVSLGVVVRTPALCSCAMCGNPRKFRGPATWQEQAGLQPGLHALEADEQARWPNLALHLRNPSRW